MPSWIDALTLDILFVLTLTFPLLVQLVLLYLVSRGLWQFTQRRYGRGVWAFFAWLGVAAHELSHAIAFLVTGAGLRRLVLFAPRGLAEYGGATGVAVPRRRPTLLGQMIVSIAPLFGCAFLAWATLRVLLPEIGSSLAGAFYPGALEAQRPLDTVFILLAGYWEALSGILADLNWFSARTYLALYLSASLGMGAAPSKDDLKLFFPAIGVLSLALLPVLVLVHAVGASGQAMVLVRRGVAWATITLGGTASAAALFGMLALGLLVLLWPVRRAIGRR